MKNDRANWTLQQHFLALASGDAFQVMKYTMTDACVDGVPKKIICYRPDEKSSVLFPIFSSVTPFEEVLDLQSRRFDVEIS